MELTEYIKENSTVKTTLDAMNDNYILSHSDKIDVALIIHFRDRDLVYKKELVSVTSLGSIFSRVTVKEAKKFSDLIKSILIEEIITGDGYQSL